MEDDFGLDDQYQGFEDTREDYNIFEENQLAFDHDLEMRDEAIEHVYDDPDDEYQEARDFEQEEFDSQAE